MRYGHTLWHSASCYEMEKLCRKQTNKAKRDRETNEINDITIDIFHSQRMQRFCFASFIRNVDGQLKNAKSYASSSSIELNISDFRNENKVVLMLYRRLTTATNQKKNPFQHSSWDATIWFCFLFCLCSRLLPTVLLSTQH